MPLSMFISITYTISSFLLTYTFIFSEFVKALKFIKTYYKKFFFWNNCLRPIMILDSFSLSLSVTMIIKTGICIIKVRINQAY